MVVKKIIRLASFVTIKAELLDAVPERRIIVPENTISNSLQQTDTRIERNLFSNSFLDVRDHLELMKRRKDKVNLHSIIRIRRYSLSVLL